MVHRYDPCVLENDGALVSLVGETNENKKSAAKKPIDACQKPEIRKASRSIQIAISTQKNLEGKKIPENLLSAKRKKRKINRNGYYFLQRCTLLLVHCANHYL